MTRYAANIAVSLKGSLEKARRAVTELKVDPTQALHDSRQGHQFLFESIETEAKALELQVLKHLGIDPGAVDFENSGFHVVPIQFTTIAEVLASTPTDIHTYWYEYGEFCPIPFSDVPGVEIRYYECPQVPVSAADRARRRGPELFVFFLDREPAFMGRQGASVKEKKWVISQDCERRLWHRVQAWQEDPTEVVALDTFLDDLVYV